MLEDDLATGPYVVGRGCFPNSEGTVQLDAAIMRGSDCNIGAVCAVERSGCSTLIPYKYIMQCSNFINLLTCMDVSLMFTATQDQ